MKLSSIFSDHMVLQAKRPIRIYGTGSGCVKIDIAGQHFEKSFEEDSWLAELPALGYGGPYIMRVSLDDKEYTFDDVYVGEVILLAGQSNIERPLDMTNFPASEYRGNDLLRCYGAPRFDGKTVFKWDEGWYLCGEDNIAKWSAIGYHIGMEITRKYNIAVGMLFCYQAASRIGTWIPREIATLEKYQLPKEELYDSAGAREEYNKPGVLYNLSEQALVPYAVDEVIWYQGESNSGPGEWKIYADLLKELILRWRADFLDEKLHFTVIQLADLDDRNDIGWRGIQEAQARIVDMLDDVDLVKCSDICESNDIHPPTKTLLSKRIFETVLKEMLEKNGL